MSAKLSHHFAVLGLGAWGTALAILLAKNGHTLSVWDKDTALIKEMQQKKENVRYLPGVPLPEFEYCETLEAAVHAAKTFLIVVPSHAFSELLQNLKPFYREQRFLWATKGLEPKTAAFLNTLVERQFPDADYAVLSGPSFAKEVAIGVPTAVALASPKQAFALELANYFHNPAFAVFISQDVVGLQLGGVYKNVLAVAIGISDGLKMGANARAALITRGLAELRTLGQKFGAEPQTLMGLSGCGDIILTCTDNQSRNRRFGLALAEGLTEEQALKKIGQVVEAVYNIDQLYRLATAQEVELPILEQVFGILKHQRPAREAIMSLFATEPSREDG